MRDWLIEARKEKGLTQAQTARNAGISQSYYAEIESGARGVSMKASIAKRIARAVGVDWQRFYEEAEQ